MDVCKDVPKIVACLCYVSKGVSTTHVHSLVGVPGMWLEGIAIDGVRWGLVKNDLLQLIVHVRTADLRKALRNKWWNLKNTGARSTRLNLIEQVATDHRNLQTHECGG